MKFFFLILFILASFNLLASDQENGSSPASNVTQSKAIRILEILPYKVKQTYIDKDKALLEVYSSGLQFEVEPILRALNGKKKLTSDQYYVLFHVAVSRFNDRSLIYPHITKAIKQAKEEENEENLKFILYATIKALYGDKRYTEINQYLTELMLLDIATIEDPLSRVEAHLLAGDIYKDIFSKNIKARTFSESNPLSSMDYFGQALYQYVEAKDNATSPNILLDAEERIRQLFIERLKAIDNKIEVTYELIDELEESNDNVTESKQEQLTNKLKELEQEISKVQDELWTLGVVIENR